MSSNAATMSQFRMLKVFNFLVYGAIAVYSSFFALYLKDYGFSNIEIGALMAGGPIVSLIANPIWAYWADRIGNNKMILTIALIGNLMIMQLVFSLNSYLFIYSAMLFFFMFQTPLFTQVNSLILNTIDGTPYKFGAFRLWGSLGWASIAALAGPLIGWLGIRQLWVVYDAMMIIAIISAFLLPAAGEAKKRANFSNSGYAKVFVNKPFMLLVLIGVLVSIPNSINITFVSLYIDELGGSKTMVGWSTFAAAILEVPVFLLLDRYMKTNVRLMAVWLAVISLLYACRWFLMSEATTALHVVIIQSLHCITFGGYFYVGTQLTSHLVPAEYRSTGQAIYQLTWGGVSGIIAGIFGGWMFENLGHQTLYQICSGFTLFGVAGFMVMWKVLSLSADSKHKDLVTAHYTKEKPL